MIQPNMATMLGFVATDARDRGPHCCSSWYAAGRRPLVQLHHDRRRHVDQRFLRPDRDRRAVRMRIESARRSLRLTALRDALIAMSHANSRKRSCATAKARPNSSTVRVEQAADERECRQVAFAIAHSPLVKTAFFASDPNLGRILAAVGYAGVDDLEPERVQMSLDDVLRRRDGGRHPAISEEDGQRVMKKSKSWCALHLGRGARRATVWTCDLSHEYVSINADYRS